MPGEHSQLFGVHSTMQANMHQLLDVACDSSHRSQLQRQTPNTRAELFHIGATWWHQTIQIGREDPEILQQDKVQIPLFSNVVCQASVKQVIDGRLVYSDWWNWLLSRFSQGIYRGRCAAEAEFFRFGWPAGKPFISLLTKGSEVVLICRETQL